MATTRPARSDPHLPPEEAARVEAEVRDYFDSFAPRRPAKPPRSDPSEDACAEPDAVDAGDHDLPELRKLRDLEAKPQVRALFFFPLHIPSTVVLEFLLRVCLLKSIGRCERDALLSGVEAGVGRRRKRGCGRWGGVRGDAVLRWAHRHRQAASHGKL